MKKTSENVTKTENGNIKIVGKKIEFVINNDENSEKTDTACQAFREWLKTPLSSKKYIDNFGIIPGGWCIDIANVTEIYHIGTAYDSITGGMVDIIYIEFENRLLNRIVYIDNEISNRGSILLPIDGKIEYIPFAFRYKTTRKTNTKTPKTENTTKKTKSTTTPTTLTKTPKTDKTTRTAEKANK